RIPGHPRVGAGRAEKIPGQERLDDLVLSLRREFRLAARTRWAAGVAFLELSSALCHRLCAVLNRRPRPTRLGNPRPPPVPPTARRAAPRPSHNAAHSPTERT